MPRNNFANLPAADQQLITDFEIKTPGIATLLLMDAPVHMRFDTAQSGFTLPATLPTDMQHMTAFKPRGIDSIDMELTYDRSSASYEVALARLAFDNGWTVTMDEPQMLEGHDGIHYKRTVRSTTDSQGNRMTTQAYAPFSETYAFLYDCGIPLTFKDEFGGIAEEEPLAEGLEALLPTVHAAAHRSLSMKKTVKLTKLQNLVVTETMDETDRYGMRMTERTDKRIGHFGVPNVAQRPPVKEAIRGIGRKHKFSTERQITVQLVNYGNTQTESYEAVLASDSPFRTLALQGLYKRVITDPGEQSLDEADAIALPFDAGLVNNLSVALDRAAF